jgi:hypothetical protein
MPMSFLAEASTARDVIAGITLIVDVVMALGLYWVGSKARAMDRVEERLHAITTKLIDERFRAMTHELNSHVQGFVLALDDMKGRLKDGDGMLENLGQMDQRIEIQLIERVSAMKQWFIENLASKADLKDHEKTVSAKFERSDEKISALTREVAVLSDRAER